MNQILIIDDGLQSAILRAKVLQRHGYHVMVATTGKLGIDYADALQPDLILLDHQLPDITGGKVNAAIKSTHPHLRVVSVSAYTDLDSWYNPAPDAFFTKGSAVSELLATVKDVLSRNSPGTD